MNFICLKAALYLLSLFCVMLARPYTSKTLCAITYFFAFALFFFSICSISKIYKRFWLATLYFLFIQLFQIRWLASTYYQGVGIVFVYLVVSLLIAFSFAVLVTLIPSGRSLRLYEILGLCSFWALLEYSRVFFFSGFTFNPLALVTFFSKDLVQLASVLGVYFLSFMVLFVNFFAYNFFLKRSVLRFLTFVFVGLLPIFIGKLLPILSTSSKLKSVRVLLMQPAVMSEEKWQLQGFAKPLLSQVDQLRWVVDELKKYEPEKLDLVVLPEVAFSEDAYEPSLLLDDVLKILPFSLRWCAPLKKGLAQKIDGVWYVCNSWVCHSLSNYFKVDLVVGLSDYDNKSKESFNALFSFKKGELKAQRHVKRVLVPLTEYLPFKWLTNFMKTFGIEEFYQKGKVDSVLDTSFFRIAPVICMEEGYSDIIKKSVQKGADLIVSSNNDVWFPYTTLSQEHLYLGLLRSIENGVFSFRSSNTGISAIIDPNGAIIHALDEFDENGNYQKGSLRAFVKMYKRPTLYSMCSFAIDRLFFSSCILYACFRLFYLRRFKKMNLQKNLLP